MLVTLERNDDKPKLLDKTELVDRRIYEVVVVEGIESEGYVAHNGSIVLGVRNRADVFGVVLHNTYVGSNWRFVDRQTSSYLKYVEIPSGILKINF